MGYFDIKKVIAAVAFVVGSVAIAVVAAPVGVPMAGNILFKDGANFKPLWTVLARAATRWAAWAGTWRSFSRASTESLRSCSG